MITEKYTLNQEAWKATTVTILRSDQPPLTDVAAKQTIVTIEFPQPDSPPVSWPFPITAVGIPDSQIFWVGVVYQPKFEKDFFIEYKNQILHGRLILDATGMIEWMPNLAEPVKDEKTLEKAIIAFDQSDIYAKLEANHWGDGRRRQMQAKPSLRYTGLTDILGLNFWGAQGTGFSQEAGDLHSSIATIEKGVVEFDLENRTIKRKARVWVDLDTRKVVKASINGKQVFPE